MGKIIIGQEYEREFASICALFEGGFLSDDIHIKKAHGNVITTPSHTFEYREREHGVNGGGDGERALTFTKEGASWFSALRGESFDSGNADWKQLIMDVAQDYHRHYSLIEFRQTKDRNALSGEKKLKEQFKTEFLNKVFSDGKAFVIAETRKTEPENFYAVSMRLEINGGGESAPLLGKIYFREGEDGKLVPVTFKEAQKIDRYIESAVPEEDGGAQDNGVLEVALVGRVFGGLEKSFKSGKFAKYVSFSGKYREEIKEMLDQLATSEVKSLECTNVKVLGISHVEWEKSVYNVSYRGKTVLKFIVGLNGYISLQCANCKEDNLLIDGNSVKLKDGGTCAELDFDKPDLGLTEEDLENIRENGEVANHLFTVTCPENPRNRDCSRIICASQAITVQDGVMKCRGCRYPEIIYTDIFSYGRQEGKYTPLLHFASDRLSLIDESTVKCRCCGREFTNSNILRGELCGFCAQDDKSAKAKKLYRKYGGMLDLSVRFAHLFSKKYCREEGNIILFELGNDRYVFDKLNVREFGFIKKPQKVKRGDKK